MLYIIKDEQRRSNCISYIAEMPINKAQSVEIKQYRKNRSKSQNRTLWMWYNTIGEHIGMTPDDLHELLKVRILGTVEKEVDGKTLVYPRSTTKLTTKEFGEFLDGVQMLAVELNCVLPIPDDLQYSYGE